jgi:hypothetical protein
MGNFTYERRTIHWKVLGGSGALAEPRTGFFRRYGHKDGQNSITPTWHRDFARISYGIHVEETAEAGTIVEWAQMSTIAPDVIL